jgi:hypothetical protein
VDGSKYRPGISFALNQGNTRLNNQRKILDPLELESMILLYNAILE